jgi:hypothetical protein
LFAVAHTEGELQAGAPGEEWLEAHLAGLGFGHVRTSSGTFARVISFGRQLRQLHERCGWQNQDGVDLPPGGPQAEVGTGPPLPRRGRCRAGRSGPAQMDADETVTCVSQTRR